MNASATQHGPSTRFSADPTPEEIRQIAAEIRREWTGTERRQRQELARVYQRRLVHTATQTAA